MDRTKKTVETKTVETRGVIGRDDLDALIVALQRQGYQVIGPQVSDGAIIYAPLDSADRLPAGWIDEQDGGRYRLERGPTPAVFAHTLGPHSWKRFLFPPQQTLWQAERRDQGFEITVPDAPTPRYAFIGVRSCEIHAMLIQDRVFMGDSFTDPGYAARRNAAFIVAVNCGRAGGTCFCASMGTGPKAERGFDLALTEIITAKRHDFLVESGSDRGAAVLAELPTRAVKGADTTAAHAATTRATEQQRRSMVEDVGPLLKRHLEHPRWDQVAERCLACANCTMVCPTCFCTTVEDSTDLAGTTAERTRRWDSCFTLDFSYIHGGSVRREGRARYRQWITHKLAHWHDQFGTSGCVGCGRCITWCPVGIDITEEARAIKASEENGASEENSEGGE